MRNDPGIIRRTALITGASSGIGYEFTKLFARDGFDLVLLARNAARLAQIAEDLGRSSDVSVTVLAKDLAKSAAAEEIFRALQGKGVDVGILVNNAGFDVYGPFWETDAQQEMQMMQVNMVALTQLTKLFLPAMVRRKYGRILNMGSLASFLPGPYDAVYYASKAYVLSFSEALAEELRGTGVTVTALCPGPTKTEFAERAQMTDSRLYRGRLLSAADVARVGYRALLRGRRSVVVGTANKLLAFSIRLTPRNLVARISRNILSRM